MSLAFDEAVLDDEKLYEVIDGQLEEKEMAGMRHGGVGTRLARRLGNYVEANGLGEVYGPDTTFKIGDNERMPDVSFVVEERLPEDESTGIVPFAPDLAIEIVSPNDSAEKLADKIRAYFAAGVLQVWTVSPEIEGISIYRSLKNVEVFLIGDELTCEDLLPGFRLPLTDIFRRRNRA
jgi:Uma2 family endonuclease